MIKLNKPYKREKLDNFITTCNLDGKIRIEYHEDAAYGLYDYEVYENGNVIDLRETEEYKAEQAIILKEQRKEEILAELETLDKKRIRALSEPDDIREDGTTWLEYYNNLIALLREELTSLM